MRTPARSTDFTYLRVSKSLKINPSLLLFKLVAAAISSQVREPFRMAASTR